MSTCSPSRRPSAARTSSPAWSCRRWATSTPISGSTSGTASPCSPASASTTSRRRSPTTSRMFGDPEVVEARSIGATCGGVRVWSLYVPNGRTLDDPHYVYKLAWLERLQVASIEWLADNPEGADRVDRRLERGAAGRGRVGHDEVRGPHPCLRSPSETRSRRSSTLATPTSYDRTPRESYTYWDYQQLAFPKKRGLRIDFILASPGPGGPRRPAPGSTARNARARAPATTRRSSSTSADRPADQLTQVGRSGQSALPVSVGLDRQHVVQLDLVALEGEP